MSPKQEPKSGFRHGWERGYTPWDVENDRNWRLAGLYNNLVINDHGIVDVPQNPSIGDTYIVASDADANTSTNADWDNIISNNQFWLDDTSLSTINNKIIQWVDLPRDADDDESYPPSAGEQWEIYHPKDGATAWNPASDKNYAYFNNAWVEINNFTDISDTPDDYSSASSGDLLIVNNSSDGLSFSSNSPVEDAGGAPSMSAGLKANRPSAGTSGRIFIAEDSQEVFRDNGSSWDLIGIAPSKIDPGELGFDPATQSELDTHTGDTSNPHQVEGSDVQIDSNDLNFDTATQSELDNHTSDTSNPHNVSISDAGGVENEGGTPSLLTDTKSNRPSAGTTGRVFIASDTREVFRDTGSSWDLIALAPGEIDSGELGFDPATQSELDNHTGDTSNPHQIDVSDVQIDSNDLNFDTATQSELDNHTSDTSNPHNTDHGGLNGLGDDDHPQYTTEQETQDIVNSLLSSGEDVTLSYDQANDKLTIDSPTLGGDSKNDIIRIASGGNPKVRTFGQLLDYAATNSFTSGLVHYVRVFLRSDQTYQWIRHYPQGSVTGVTFDVGVYTETSDKPDSLVASSGVVTRDITADEFLDIELSTTFSPSTSGVYWIAVVNNEGHDTKVTPTAVNAGVSSLPVFHPALTEARSASNGLPSTASAVVSSVKWPWFAGVAQ